MAQKITTTKAWAIVTPRGRITDGMTYETCNDARIYCTQTHRRSHGPKLVRPRAEDQARANAEGRDMRYTYTLSQGGGFRR